MIFHHEKMPHESPSPWVAMICWKDVNLHQMHLKTHPKITKGVKFLHFRNGLTRDRNDSIHQVSPVQKKLPSQKNQPWIYIHMQDAGSKNTSDNDGVTFFAIEKKTPIKP